MSQSDLQSSTLAVILDLGRLVCSSLDLDEVLQRVLTAAQDLSKADTISIMLLDQDDAMLVIVASLGIPPDVEQTLRMPLGTGIAGWVAQQDVPFHDIHPEHDPRYWAVSDRPQACLLSLPLRVRDQVVGVLNLTRTHEARLFSPEIVQTIEIFASHAAIAINNAAAAVTLRHAAVRERMVRLVSQGAHRVQTPEPLISQMLSDLVDTLEAQHSALVLSSDAQLRVLACYPPEQHATYAAWNPLEAAANPTYWAKQGYLWVALPADAGYVGWLVICRGAPQHYWRSDERHLLAFVAEQIVQTLQHAALVAAEQRNRALTQTLSRLAAACNAMIDQVSVLDYILEQLAVFVSYDSASVFLYHDTQYARMVAGRGFDFPSTDVVLYMGPGSFTWQVREQRRAIYIPDVHTEPGWQSVPGSDQIHAWIGVPLVVNQVMVGMLAIDKWERHGFNTTDIHVAELFGDHMAVAIHNARLLQEAQTLASQLQVLHQLSTRLAAIQAVQPMLAEVAQQLHANFGYYQVLIALLDDDYLVLQAACGRINATNAIEYIQRFSIQEGISGWVVRHAQTQLVNDVRTDARYAFHPQLADTAAELIVPIMSTGTVLGVILIDSTRLGAFGQGDVHLVEAVANQTAVALENIRRYNELQQTQEHLIHNERMRALGELSSGVAHDFNNLLTAILGHTQILLSDLHDPIVLESLTIVERAALDGAATVRRLRSFAQTNGEQLDELVDLNSIIEESLGLTRPRWRDAMQRQGIGLQVIHAPTPLPPIMGDAAALRELVMNLVLNALDAMPNGGLLELLAQVEGTEVVLSVRDTGVGIDPAIQRRIFDPFFSTKGLRGTGMGLAMSYAIVQRHQGTITVQSTSGAGACFRIRLPYVQEPEAPAPRPAALPTPPQASAPLQILLAEDDPAVRNVLQQTLVRQGHCVTAVDSGEAALAQLQQRSFDLLCTDLGMPTMSGWELIQQARADMPQLPTILITGWGEQISPAEARERGADRVIAKPFDAHYLREVIADLLHERTILVQPDEHRP